MKINARYALAAILSIMLLTILVGGIAAANAADASADKQTTDYGTVDWSAATQGYITFTASGQERVFVLQGPNGTRTGLAVDGGETIKIALMDGTGTYQYAIGRCTADGTACRIKYKGRYTASKIGADPAP